VPTKEASWAAVRDKLVAGELDAAHILYGLLYGLELGIAGKPQSMANLMTLNQNGQAITLSSDLQEKGVTDGGLKKLIGQQRAGHLHLCPHLPDRHARHVALLLAGERGHQPLYRHSHGGRAAAADGDEHAHRQHGRLLRRRTVERRAINDRIGFTAATSQSWPDHPEKILGTRSDWVEQNPHTARALVCAVMEAAAGLTPPMITNAKPRASSRVGRGLTPKSSISPGACSANTTTVRAALAGRAPDPLFNEGQVSYPWLRRHVVFNPVPPLGIAEKRAGLCGHRQRINRIDVWKDAATAVGALRRLRRPCAAAH
jgi:nitrate/nitrite transport system substrate-binding protein